jgi:hypothetical protein
VGIGAERSPSIRSAQRALLKTNSAAAAGGFDWYVDYEDYYYY